MTIKIIGIVIHIVEWIEGTLRIEIAHMTGAEAGIEITVEDLGEADEEVDLEIETGLN